MISINRFKEGSRLRSFLLAFAAGAMVLGGGSSFAASNVDGSISGEVTADGQAVSGATVTITNAGTGISRTTTTDAEGDFRFSSVPVGTYDVSVTSSQGSATRSGVTVNVGTGSQVNLVVGDAAELGEVTVQGATISPIDIGSTESATILGEQTVDRLPLGRNVTSVALLAPGTTRGDSDFGSLASFGGSTVGENVCYINGLNVTDFNNGLGCSTVPFEFYQEFQLKTGGYSAEFGRSTGGVINAVTKSGTNEFKYGFNLYYTPFLDDISGTDPDVYYQDGNLFQDNSGDETERMEMNLWASGPIIQDKAFFFVLYNPRDVSTINRTRGQGTLDIASGNIYGIESETEDTSGFWGTKLDFNISSNHVIELTAFSDERDAERTYYEIDNSTLGRLGYNSGVTFTNGGSSYSARYTGYLTPDFTLSVMYGENEQNNDTTTNDDTIPAVLDIGNYSPSGDTIRVGSVGAGLVEDRTDTREATRVDAEWFLGDHSLKFGIDFETNTSVQDTRYTGTRGRNVITGTNFSERAGVVYYNYGTHYRERTYHNPNTSFETETNALYIEDKWQVTDDVVLSLGLRNESFTNKNADGEAFIEIDNQIAPRLGVAWDVNGDGTLKLFANYGRYHLPVATNTNVRLAGNEYYVESRYAQQDNLNQDPAGGPAGADGVHDYDVNGLPVITAPTCEPCSIFANGQTKETTSSVDQDIDAMYQDEFIVGFLQEVGDGWSLGVRAIRRDLVSTIEDIAIDAALNQYAADNGHNFQAYGFDYYVLTNPGEDVTIDINFTDDLNSDGIVDISDQDFSATTPERVTIDSKDAGFPESERYYNAIEFLFEKAWNGEYFLQGSYTWSQSYGNNEGFVRSDNGQDDAGLTTLFDQPGLLDGAYGYLPNDRRHALKVFGAYQLADHWQIGANLLMESGRPINAFGDHPTDGFAWAYGSESFYQDGILVPRGSRGRTAFVSQLDLSLKYIRAVGDGEMTLGVDVFNVFDAHAVKEVDEVADLSCATFPDVFFGPNPSWPYVPGGQGLCTPNPSYGLATAHQAPRSVRFFAQFTF